MGLRRNYAGKGEESKRAEPLGEGSDKRLEKEELVKLLNWTG